MTVEFDSINSFKDHVSKQSLTGRMDVKQPKPEQSKEVQQKPKQEEPKERPRVQRPSSEGGGNIGGNISAPEGGQVQPSPVEPAPAQQQARPELVGEPAEAPVSEDVSQEQYAEDQRRNLGRVPRREPEIKNSDVVTADMFGGLMYYGEDLSYHMNDISKQMRPYMSEALFRGVKAYLTYTKGDRIHRMNQGQFLSYLLIKTFPPEIRHVIMKEMPPQNGNDIIIAQLKEDDMRESSPASLANIAASVQEISAQMRLMLDADLSRDEMMSIYLPSILYASTWLLTDRMDLREKVSPRLSFNEYLNGEQTVPPNADSVIRAGEGLQRRLDQKNNEARSGNIFSKAAGKGSNKL